MKPFITRLKRMVISKRFWADIIAKIVLGLVIWVVKIALFKN
ncbi:hypothetical protein [Fictibacillus sp. FJAT-27399]|nr:hypothetical protein [Fictibacillus sp. FJAT-27399]